MNTPERFSDAMLEQDIRRLETEVARRVSSSEQGPERLPAGGQGREAVRGAVGAVIGNERAPMPQVGAPEPAGGGVLPSYTDAAPDDVKLEAERLIDLALHRGVDVAATEARKKSPFVLDAFHDALTDRLYPEFKERGLVK
ncbi:MAG: hypothetical protein HYS43_01025 [Candidatus Liptonbacteria bacterium]|nr:hypothetical protein [Candidatus Liptonbacteria bacterium]